MLFDPHRFLAALADSTRLRILILLYRSGELCVCELVTALDTHQPKVSKHLAILRKQSLIKARREGQWMHYRLDPQIPTWANNVIRELVAGCESQNEFIADMNRLENIALSLRCG